MLEQLGHIRQDVGNPADTWVRIALIRAVQNAVDQEVGDARDAIIAFQDMFTSDAGGTCPACEQFEAGGPCALHSCALDASSATCVNTGTVQLPLPLTGVNTIGVCNSPMLTGAYALIGYPSKGLTPVDLGGGTVACVTTQGGEGWLTKCSGGTEPTVSTSICQDHIVGSQSCVKGPTPGNICVKDSDCGTGGTCQADAAPVDVNECPGTCGPTTPDEECGSTVGTGCGISTGAAHPGVINGGACLKTTLGPATAGHAFFANTTQITVIFSGQEGTDGIDCTADDTPVAPGVPSTIPLTTETATANIIDNNNTNGAVLPTGVGACASQETVTGSLFDCSQVEASNLSGGKLAGAFPALHALFGPPRKDSITTFALTCQ